MTTPLQPPESKEGKEKSTNQALAEDFSAALLVSEERRVNIVRNLTKILDKGKIETARDRELVKHWIESATQLNLEALKCKTDTSLTNSEITAKLGKKAEEFFEAREKVLESLLKMLKAPSAMEKTVDPKTKEAKKINGVFVERDSSDVTLDDEMSKIEDEIFYYTDPSNKLHRYGKSALPNFKRIDELRKQIYNAKELIHPKATPAERAATLARLNRMEMALDTIMSMDPIGRMKSLPEFGAQNIKRTCPQAYACAEKLGLIGKGGKLNLAPPGVEPVDKHRSPMALTARAAGFGVFAILFLLSAITTGKKIVKGKGLSHSDALTAAYGVGTLALAGTNILPSKPSEVEALNKLLSIRNDPQCKSAIAKMGGNAEAAKVVNDFHDLVSDASDGREIWKIINKPIALKAANFKQYVKKTDPFYAAIEKVEGETKEAKIDQVNLKHFLTTLKNLEIEKPEKVTEIVMAVEFPEKIPG